jgi:DNA-binding CsgD family transcriptional regulator
MSRQRGGVPKDLVALEGPETDVALLSFTLPGNGRLYPLTPAESEVIVHVLAGRTNAEIAAARGTSTRTVANQVASLFRKLGVASRLELVVRWPLLVDEGRAVGPTSKE